MLSDYMTATVCDNCRKVVENAVKQMLEREKRTKDDLTWLQKQYQSLETKYEESGKYITALEQTNTAIKAKLRSTEQLLASTPPMTMTSEAHKAAESATESIVNQLLSGSSGGGGMATTTTNSGGSGSGGGIPNAYDVITTRAKNQLASIKERVSAEFAAGKTTCKYYCGRPGSDGRSEVGMIYGDQMWKDLSILLLDDESLTTVVSTIEIDWKVKGASVVHLIFHARRPGYTAPMKFT